LQWDIREMPRKVFRFCYSAFASISFRIGIWYADSDRHELCFVSSAQIVSARLVRGVAPDGPSLMWVIFKTKAPYFHRSLKECPGR
jgi:hypothetical protein